MNELVKELREYSVDWHERPPLSALLGQAADAIEKLQGQIDGWIEQERKALLKSVPKWIPVTERLPEHTKLVLVRHRSETGNKFYGLDVFDGYGWVVCLNVTHWMPLPEPPKEETRPLSISDLDG